MFELFKSEFKKWQERFGLNGYHIFFKYEPIDGSFANITINQGDMVATVRLNSKPDKEEKPFIDVKRSAKHEAVHLLCGRLHQDGGYRYCSSSEINEAEEELVNRLVNLIPDYE
ncbi:MAG: hypothetical protein A2158_00050 [Chloroflexi bacterium RBG_13_46_14]|nr:MAG: hypothetical protein A2158_00050 [Chloroflexi bacterium RBG_13_46_14]